jgi:putative endonuclease
MTTHPRPAAGSATPFPVSASAARKRALGAYGETLAARRLVAGGMVLLDRNWRGRHGEIDLVLRDRDVLVICEVKTRTTADYGTPHEGVGQRKLDRLRRLAAEWLRHHDIHPLDVRIDMVAVLRPRRGPSEIEHVRGIG